MTFRSRLVCLSISFAAFLLTNFSVAAQERNFPTRVSELLHKVQSQINSLRDHTFSLFESDYWDWGELDRYELIDNWKEGDFCPELQFQFFRFCHSVPKAILIPPPSSPILRQEFYRLLQDEDPTIVLRTMDYFASQLYFDDESPRIEAEFVRLMDHPNHEIAFKAIDVCVDFGIRFDLVLKKAFELLEEGPSVEQFKSSNFYKFVEKSSGRFWTDHIFCTGIIRERSLEMVFRELTSKHESRRNFAIILLRGFRFIEVLEWNRLVERLPEPYGATAIQVLEKYYWHLPRDASDADYRTQQLKQFYEHELPFRFAENQLKKAPQSPEALNMVNSLIEAEKLEYLPLLEELAYLPPGSTFYVQSGILKENDALYRLWKQEHSQSVALMDKILSLASEAENRDIPRFSSLGVGNEKTIAASELPFALEILKYDVVAAIQAMKHMGEPVITASGPYQEFNYGHFHFFELHRHEEIEAPYPVSMLDELDKLFLNENSPARFAILEILAEAGRHRQEYCAFLNDLLIQSIEQRKFDETCQATLHLAAIIGSSEPGLAEGVMKVVTAFHKHINSQGSLGGCISAVPFKALFMHSSFEVLNVIQHENDDWLVELANQYVNDVIDSRDAEHEWDRFCLAYLQSFYHKSQRAAEILWKEYLKTRPEPGEEFEFGWLTENGEQLLATINLSPNPRPYLDELTKLVRQHLRYWESEGFKIVFPDEATLILEFLAMFDRQESWTVNLPFERYAPLLNHIAIRTVEQSESVDNSFWLVSACAHLMRPYFEHHGSTNPLLETYRRRQHELQKHYYYQGGAIYDDRFIVFNSLTEAIRLEKFSGEWLKPYLTRMERSAVIPMEIRAQAALTLSVIEPDNPAHLNQISEILKTGFPLESKYHRAVRKRENAQ
jgi:hypothetical protein